MIHYDLTKIKALVFDVDGVLSAETITMDADGQPLRTVNIKDGYALQLAVKMGLHVAIISGARVESIRRRYEGLGVPTADIHIGASVKLPIYEEFLQKHNLTDAEVLFMGDDIPDLEVLRRTGCPCCPADAAHEIKSACLYISHLRGGYGCARDVVEQVLRAQSHWLADRRAFGW